MNSIDRFNNVTNNLMLDFKEEVKKLTGNNKKKKNNKTKWPWDKILDIHKLFYNHIFFIMLYNFFNFEMSKNKYL